MKVSRDIYLMYYIYQNYGLEFVSFSELCEKLEGKLTKSGILSSASTLSEWSILKGAYGPVGPNRVGSGWKIDEKYGIVYKLESEAINLDEVEIV